MSKLKNYSSTPASNNSAVPNGWPEGMAPSKVNDCAREMMARMAEWYQDAQWINLHTPTYVSTTQFTVTGDQTAYYTVGRRVKASGTTPFTIYGTITASAYTSSTAVTVNWDGAGALNNTLNKVQFGILSTEANAEVSETVAYNNQTGTSYILTASDNGKVVTMSNASANTVTVPQELTESLQQGFHCIVRQIGAGQTTIAKEGSDTLNAPNGKKLRAQHSSAFIDLSVSGSPNTWNMVGDTTS